MQLLRDNKSAISIAHNLVQPDRTKYIEIDKHFIKEKLESRLICTSYVSSTDQLVASSPSGYKQRHLVISVAS